MLNNSSISFNNYCTLQAFLSKSIKRDRYPSTITWQQIKRQQRDYGKNRRIKQLKKFICGLSMISSVVLFLKSRAHAL
jgi:hypothetical protein